MLFSRDTDHGAATTFLYGARALDGGRWVSATGDPCSRRMLHSGPTLLVEHPADHDQEDAERQESDVPGRRGAQVVADVVDAQDLVVDQALHKVEDSHPVRTRPRWNDQLGARRPLRHAVSAATEAAITRNHVATWQKPSASVFTSRPATVATGYSSMWLTM